MVTEGRAKDGDIIVLPHTKFQDITSKESETKIDRCASAITSSQDNAEYFSWTSSPIARCQWSQDTSGDTQVGG